MTRLYIGRHAEASFNAPSDRERPLTQGGVAQTKRLANLHKAALTGVRVIWSSELVRAQQTAQIYSDCLHVPIETKSFLAPDCPPGGVIDKLQALQSQQDEILMISHQPLVGELVSLLCSGNVYDSHPFMTSEIVVLEYDFPGEGVASRMAGICP